MNDLNAPFTLPSPEATAWRQAARAGRRMVLRWRREWARGEARKEWNARLNWREFWHGQTTLTSYPRLVQVGTNWTCNLKCSFCRLTMPWTQTQMRQKAGGELQLSARVEAALERLLPHAEAMTLTPLGEPLMWSGLKNFLEVHRRVGSRNLALTTNGQLLTDAMAERLVRGELAQMTVSCDSNDPEMYAGMRVGGKLSAVEDGVRRVVAWRERLGVAGPRLLLNATFMRRNIAQLPSMVGWAHQLGFDQLGVQLMEIENPEQESEFLGHTPVLARRYVSEALEIGRRVGLRVQPGLALRNLISAAGEGHDVGAHSFQGASPLMPEEARLTSNGESGELLATPEALGELDAALDMRRMALVEKCHYPWYNLLVDTDGEARPCCWADTSWGNLNQLEFDAIWNGHRAQGMRRSFLANKIPPGCQKKYCRVDL